MDMQLDQPGTLVVVHLDHALPVFDQVLDVAGGLKRKDRVEFWQGVERRQVVFLKHPFDLALDEFVQNIGVRRTGA